jgi:guanosine-3',5'-bis(diphosphate) 3'-pyrophosphohydrolase
MQAENFRKMLLTLNDDVRVILIKLADRLHNMQTMESMVPETSQNRFGNFIHLCTPRPSIRVVQYQIKARRFRFQIHRTRRNADIVSKMKETKEEQEAYITSISDVLKKSLDEEGIEYTIKGRPNQSTPFVAKCWHKVSFDEVYDKFALELFINQTNTTKNSSLGKYIPSSPTIIAPAPADYAIGFRLPKSTGYEAFTSPLWDQKAVG